MSSELSILALYGLLTVVIIVVQVTLAIPKMGLPYLATPRDEPRELDGVAGRALRCLNNSVIAMALFAPAILILQAKGAFSDTTLLMAQIFLIARVLYVGIYLAGIPWLRTGVWGVGAIATAYLYILAI
ncbi:MAG: MAPEG family protein [Boseongicola sp.]|nr:MAG: MAPEG family protein [Boseongicola sp.]